MGVLTGVSFFFWQLSRGDFRTGVRGEFDFMGVFTGVFSLFPGFSGWAVETSGRGSRGIGFHGVFTGVSFFFTGVSLDPLA